MSDVKVEFIAKALSKWIEWQCIRSADPNSHHDEDYNSLGAFNGWKKKRIARRVFLPSI